MAYSLSSSKANSEVYTCSTECEQSYAQLKKLYDTQREQLGDTSIEIQAYTQSLKKVEAQLVIHQKNQLWYEENIRFMKIDLDDKTNVPTYHKKLLAEAVKEKEELKTKLESFETSSKSLNTLLNSQLSANDKVGFGHNGANESKVSETITNVFKVETSNDKVEMPKIKTVRMSEPIIEEWESDSEDDEIVVKPKEVTKTVKPSFEKIESVNARNETVRQAENPRKNNKSPRGNKRNWNGMMTQKLGENFEFNNKACYNFGRFSHPNPKSNIVPQAVLTKSGLVSLNTAKSVSTAQSRKTMNDAMPTTYSYYKAYSSVKRPFNKKTANYNRYFNKRVNTVKSTRVNTARPKAEVNTIKASASWVWKPKHEELDHVFKSNSASKTLTRYDYVDALGRKIEVAIVLEGVSDKQQVIRVWRSGYSRNIWQLVKKYDFNAASGFENWQATKDRRIFRCSFHFNTTNEQTATGLAIPGQTATGKESSNPFMAGSLPKTIHFCDSLQSDEDSFELIELMILCTNFLTMVRDLENLKTTYLIMKKVWVRMHPNRGGLMMQMWRLPSLMRLQMMLETRTTRFQTAIRSEEVFGYILLDKYVAKILKKFDFASVKTASTPIETQKPLVKDEEATDVDVHLYRSMIGSLMYLTASRPDIMFAICACSRFQVTLKTSHLDDVKRIFRYLKGKPKLGLWYPRVSSFDLEAYSDKAEYVAAANYCGQVLWIQNQMLDYGFNFMNTKIYIDNESTICIVKNPVFHSKTKHIAIRHHFIRDAYEKKLIQVLKIHTDDNVANLLTKAFDVSRILAFDDLDDIVDDAMGLHGVLDAQDEGRTSSEVLEEKENIQKGVSTEVKVSTIKPDEGTAEPKDGTSDESTAPTMVFRDDETIADFLVSMSQNKTKQKGVEIKDAEDSDRPKATSTRSVLTLKPLPKIDPKDNGNKVLKEEAESDAESEGARIEADRLLAARLQEEEREMFTVKRNDKNFIAIGSAEDERQIKKLNEESKDPKKKRVVYETPREEDTLTAKVHNPDDDSDDEHRKCLRIVTFDSTLDSEIMETKSFVAKLHKVSSLDGDYLIVYRANGHFRVFNYLMEVLHIFDRQDLFHLYDLVMKQYSEITPEGIELILWGNLKIIVIPPVLAGSLELVPNLTNLISPIM
ncbi:hypothetical protein Tco_0728484 [Tanacetum coccineum]|uniref:Reverse transcriptase Ty1/copia-type domain-containing protein n=1 Tax=Tanacetum coccineum TaxID=301880 RepID=A0ABQ4YPB5_9ASTR